MKKLSSEQMDVISAGYCDSTIYALTGVCTNAGCIVATAYNIVAGAAGLDHMVCAL